MKKIQTILCFLFIGITFNAFAQNKSIVVQGQPMGKGWKDLFGNNLSKAIYDKSIWKDSSGVITASKDDAIWSFDEYDDFILDLDFQTADGTNSGVIVHATDIVEWIPNSVEIQIADDYSKQWSKAAPTWQCAAIFGRKPATNKSLKPAGEWNHFTITCKGKMISIVLNGTLVNECNMDDFTSSKVNPDGSTVPSWLKNPMSTLALRGHIGLQGKHAGAPIYFRNVKVFKLS
ncbi:MAG: hypothetical protein RIT30_793 [Bacteroidota bacterium]|jgi:hypothetical protein